MNHRVRIFVAGCALSFLGFGCASGPPPGAPERVVATAGADGVQRVTVLAGNFFFSPSRIAVKAGAPVELTISREAGFVPHNFTLQAAEAGISVSEELGTTPKVVRFTATRPGSYEFSCDKDPPLFKSHRSQGMVGTLEVVP